MPEPSPSPVVDVVRALHSEYQELDDGTVATYIPELGKADPAWFAIALVTADGHSFGVGDTAVEFTLQSVSKPFAYGLALEDRGAERVLESVGVEPSGNAFNAVVVDEHTGRPFNPMVNAGAIVTTGLIDGGADGGVRFDRLRDGFARFAGRPLDLDDQVYGSERSTGDRNRALAYLMRSFGALEGDADAVVDDYFRQCSLLVSCHDLAVMAATLANRGVNPVTGQRALDESWVEHVLSVMSTCGMYDYSGEWAYRVGLPAKSGVSGGVIAVLPGQVGIGVFSPLLDDRGNSVRGLRVCERLAAEFALHPFRFQPDVGSVVRRSIVGGAARSNRVRTTEESDALSSRSGAIRVHELQGNLFFGTMERAFRAVLEDLDGVEFVVVDLQRVRLVDPAARAMLDEVGAAAEQAGASVVFAHVPRGAEVADRWFAPTRYPTFVDTDRALEWCENQILERQAAATTRHASELSAQELLAGVSDEGLQALGASVIRREVAAGESVFREGDPATSMYFVLSGLFTVQVPLGPDGVARRLATVGPGLAFGEMAVLDEGRRSADVVADTHGLLAELPVERLRAIAEEDPGTLVTITRNLARDLSRRLRRANGQIRALE